jgi:hypothetical protein
MGGAHDAHGVRRIGRHIDDVRIERIDRAHDRRVVGGRRRVAHIRHGFKTAELLAALPRAVRGILREFGISGDDRDSLGSRLGRSRKLEETECKRLLRLRTGRQHREVLIIMEFTVGGIGENADGGLLVLHQDRNGRRDHVGRIWTDQKIDLVDFDKLRIELWNVGRVALVIVVDKLDLASEQAPFGIDIVAPDFQSGEHLLSDRRDTAGQCHAHAHPDRVGRFCHIGHDQHANRKECAERASSSPKLQIAHLPYSSLTA